MKFTGKNYQQYLDEVITFKELQTKYSKIELLGSSFDGLLIIPMTTNHKFLLNKYFNHRVLSSCDYLDTQTTSVNIHIKELDNLKRYCANKKCTHRLCEHHISNRQNNEYSLLSGFFINSKYCQLKKSKPVRDKE